MITLSPGNPMRVVLMTVLIFEVIVYRSRRSGHDLHLRRAWLLLPAASAVARRCWPWWQPGCFGVRLATFSAG